MTKTIEIVVEGARLADAALAPSQDAIHLFHHVDDTLRRRGSLILTAAQRNHLASGHRIVIKDQHGNAFTID